MNQTTKTILIVAGVAVAAFLAYQYMQKKKASNSTPAGQAPGTAGNASSATNTTGSSTGSQVNDYVSAASGLWDDVSSLWQ